jgi:hypothetical protein
MGSWRKHPPEVIALINKFGGGRVHMQQLPVPPLPPTATEEALKKYLSTFSPEALGAELGGLGLAAVSSTAWGTANQGMIVPITLVEPFDLRMFYVVNGSVISGNFDLGLYDTEGQLIRSLGSTAQAGANTLQRVAVAPEMLQPGDYYLSASFSSATATVFAKTLPNAGVEQALGVYEQASALPLPTRFIAAVGTLAFLPLIGMSEAFTI